MNAIVEFTQQFFSNLLGQTEQDGVHAFNGGVHPPQHKSESTQSPISTLPIPEELTLPLRQHIGNLPKVCVKTGDHVLKGELLAEAEGNVSAAIHAPTSGTIKAIAEAVIPHPSGLKDHCIILAPDGKDTWGERKTIDWRNTDKHSLVKALRDSGIVGLGGATFPSHIKLRTDGSTNIETLIINAAECEPYITCDDMLMREQAEAIAKGIEIVKHMLGAEHCVIGIEDNKPDAEQALQEFAAQYGYSLKRVPTLYPSGDARRLVHLITGQEVPHNRRSTEIGVQVFNIATVLAVHRYFDEGQPAISRIVTITGAVKHPQNFEVLFGTPLADLVAAAGGAHQDTSHFIMGGPMMGFNLPLNNVPITKAANCIIAVTPTLFEAPPPAMPCIRCARCADACPVSLQPQELYWFAKSDQFEKAREYDLFDCIECGCCSYVCPSNIPLVQHYRYAKSEVIATDKAKEAADLARERNEFRLARIEREKEERAQKQAERAQAAKARQEAAKKAQGTQADEVGAKAESGKAMKQEAIAAAMARAKAQKAANQAAGVAPKNTDNLSESTAAKIAEIDASRNQATGNDAETEKQAKIQAAIEKAKAAKAQKAANSADKPASSDSDKQAKIAAAVAKAKAKKAAAQNKAADNAAPAGTAEDDKQAKIQAAIEKAKAAKAAAQVKDKPKADVNPTPEDDKQAKIAAAIAKAKATATQDKQAVDIGEKPQAEASEKTPKTKEDKIKAAIAKAKAKKAAADAAKQTKDKPEDS